MCLAIDLFQASTPNTKCIIILLIINSVFSVIYLTILSLIFVILDQSSQNRVEHWVWIFSGLAVLIWAVAMLTITIIWCMCRNYALRKDQDVELGDVSEKVKKTLGVDERVVKKNERSNLVIKPKVEEIKIEAAEITPLPEYSPEARNSMFDFSEESVQKMENERSHSPFQEFLHLVQVESPGTPEKALHDHCLNRISEEPMYDIPLRPSPTAEEQTAGFFESHDKKPLFAEKSAKKLTKRKSQMFLGNIGKSSSVVSELFVELDKGSVVPESVVVTGRYQVLSD